LQRTEPDHYATLGLDHRCTTEQIRSAYRLLAKRHHPDLNPGSSEAAARTRALNAAHETLSDPERREAYDLELASARKSTRPARGSKVDRNLAQEVHLRIEDLLRGTTLEVRVNDPSNPNGPETYPLAIPPETAPGARLRVPRAEGGFVLVRVRARPDFRFKVRGSDLRCDLKIKPERAIQGGTEMVRGINGTQLRVSIPRGAARGETIRISGEGLPKPRGGRGDLLVRITYRVDVRIRKPAGR
jgi:curved DNA-binding protein